MIPNFKTYIEESIWRNISQRSEGIKSRKEDGIEQLDMVGLYKYILSHYELTEKKHGMTYGTENMSITISKNGREEILLIYGFYEIHLFFNLEKDTKLFYVLTEKYNVEKWDSKFTKYHYVVTPKNGHSNKFFIDVLNDIIENKNTILRKKK